MFSRSSAAHSPAAGGFLSAFRLPPSRKRRKPADLAYGADDRPGAGLIFGLGVQHAGMAIALSSYALVAAKMAGLSLEDTQSFLACTIIGMAIATFFQSFGGRIGAGALIVHLPDPVMAPFVASIVAAYGLGSLVPLGITAGIAGIVISRLLPHLRPLFPPTVIGVVVCVGGFTLISGALKHSLGLNATFAVDLPSILISGVTLAVIVGFSIWGNRPMKLFSLMAGILAGVIVAALCGYVEGAERFASAPVFALPKLPSPDFSVPASALVVVGIVALLVQLDTFASVVIMDKMDDADWHRADMKMVGSSILGAGIANIATGFLGGMTNATSSANIGLAHATRCTSRYVGLAAAAMILLVALMPLATLALTLIPDAVIGGVEIYAAAFFIVSGLELAASRELDSRGVFMIGISITIGLGVMLLPGIVANVPEALHHMVGSGFVMAGITAVSLNLLFRLGTAMKARRELPSSPAEASQAIVEFLEIQGGAWAARREVVKRATLAALEAAEFIAGAGEGRHPIAIQARFDEFNLDVDIVHSGPPLVLRPAVAAPDLNALFDADDAAIDAAIANVSHVLIERLADRVRAGTRDGFAHVTLHFNH
ncbi:purine/pyrimidine permease [Ancylobacter sp. 6x-1]|uniref:Purine/pyrimidine permease n=1 Tax=Ancylobacter crimeensis TaxID=2579147 RepID=A0ABT0DBK6_9HYPH|nr:solute carrier family 23 protein [Ancylobacter crimeensis]MCK0197338.1 purine/pyrimidine permease [Ancylobacter crimeensis]